MNDSSTATPLPASDAGSTPNLSIVPAPKAKHRQPSRLDRQQEQEIRKAGIVVSAASRPPYAQALAARDMDDAFMATLKNDIQNTLEKSHTAIECDAAKSGAQRAEQETGRALLRKLRIIQMAARQKHLPAHPENLRPYHVGEILDESRAALEAYSQNIIQKANEERPPGIDTDFVADAQSAREAYLSSLTAQSAEKARAKQTREDRDQMVESIKQRRMKIMRAIDAAFPHTLGSSTQARAEFLLPRNRPYSY